MLELACFHPQAVDLAARWAVPQVEFCADALAGGTTPKKADVRAVRAGYEGRLGAMVRPIGGSFAYDAAGWLQMHRDLEAMAHAGVDFVVFGALDDRGQWDADRIRAVVAESPVPCVLHRVFDEFSAPLEALEWAISAGFQRILTGWGGKDMDQLKALHKAAAGRIELLPGGGIRAHNAAPYRAAGFEWLHTAALSPEAYAAEVPLPDETEVKTLLAG